jgi:putative ABC transport system permease protein
MFGVAVVVWTAATGASFERFVVDTNMATRRGDLIVDGAIDMPAVGEGEPRLAEEVLDALAATPGVAAVGADVYATAHDPEVGIVALDGVRLQDDRFGDWHLEPGALPDALARVARGEAVLADRSFADGNELRVGDVVRLTTPSGVLERPLAGITRPTFVSSAGDVVLERRVYRDAWHDQTINRAYVLLEDGASPEVVRERIRDGAGRRFRLRVTDMQTHASWLADSVRRGFAFVDAMAVIMLLVVLIGTGDALASNVGERTRELGTLRAMGYTPRALAQMILAQGLAVGVTGSALAVVVGMAMSVAFVSGVLPATLGWQLALDPTYGLAALVAVLGVVASVLGAVLPAVRAARIPVATVLRWE